MHFDEVQTRFSKTWVKNKRWIMFLFVTQLLHVPDCNGTQASTKLPAPLTKQLGPAQTSLVSHNGRCTGLVNGTCFTQATLHAQHPPSDMVRMKILP